MEKVILDAMGSANYRKRIVTIMQESLQSPMIKLEIYEMLRQAVREELNPKEKKDGQKKSGESGESGEDGGDSGESSDESGEGDAEGS